MTAVSCTTSAETARRAAVAEGGACTGLPVGTTRAVRRYVRVPTFRTCAIVVLATGGTIGVRSATETTRGTANAEARAGAGLEAAGRTTAAVGRDVANSLGRNTRDDEGDGGECIEDVHDESQSEHESRSCGNFAGTEAAGHSYYMCLRRVSLEGSSQPHSFDFLKDSGSAAVTH